VIDRLQASAGLDVGFFRDDRCYVLSEKIEFCSIGCWFRDII
jgi:hypothetical protein